jgi:hypothetical protein
MKNLEKHFKIRPYEPPDRGFVFKPYCNCVVQSLLGESYSAKHHASYIHERIAKRLNENIENGSYQIRVVSEQNNPDHTVAFIIFETIGNNCVWLYTKLMFRKLGIAKWLVQSFLDTESTIHCPVHTKACHHYRCNHPNSPFEFNPFAMEKDFI